MIWYILFITLASLYELNVFGDFNPPDCISVYQIKTIKSIFQVQLCSVFCIGSTVLSQHQRRPHNEEEKGKLKYSIMHVLSIMLHQYPVQTCLLKCCLLKSYLVMIHCLDYHFVLYRTCYFLHCLVIIYNLTKIDISAGLWFVYDKVRHSIISN